MTLKNSYNFERDAYGFTVRPQHLERYREYASIYQEEEEERSEKWKSFLEDHLKPAQEQLSAEDNTTLPSEVTEPKSEANLDVSGEGDGSTGRNPTPDTDLKNTLHTELENQPRLGANKEGDDPNGGNLISDTAKEVPVAVQAKECEVQWTHIGESLGAIEDMMSYRVTNRNVKGEQKTTTLNEEFVEKLEENLHDNVGMKEYAVSEETTSESFFPWKDEFGFLVHGGVPRDLRGEVWQAFVGVSARRVESYYQDLLASELEVGSDSACGSTAPEKWRKQIEKDLPRTFPGHPALNENGRNSLRRLLVAYARHNPSVGYCQAMNFFAGLLLLMMPEENAFWTLVGIMDDYFDGYFSEEMIESQVDQLVFEDLIRERFPRLVSHLDYLGVQVAWISGPWFLSIYVNMLPWESVLRVWDVLLFEGNRVMLFRTGLALMELYGPALVTTKDAGDAITLLQTLAGSTFDSSQLVLTACMGFLNVNEDTLQQLRQKHRPGVVAATVAAAQERAAETRVWKNTKRLASKLYSFKHESAASHAKETNSIEGSGDNKVLERSLSRAESCSSNPDDILNALYIDAELESIPDLHQQVVWLKVEYCRILEEKRAATLRAEELETALVEMAEQDNRRELSARAEQLEQEVIQLKKTLDDKKEQENVMLQVLLRVEQEQKVTEDARVSAEQDAAAQRSAVHVLQEKYEKVMASLAQMEKRVAMAESMLEATNESKEVKAGTNPRSVPPDSVKELPKRSILSFGLGWRDRNKGTPSNVATPGESKSSNDELDVKCSPVQSNELQESER